MNEPGKPSTSIQDEDEKVYCICRTRYKKHDFMISCDRCGEWFHGDCIKMTEVFSMNVDIYHCEPCSIKYNVPQLKYTAEYQRDLDRVQREKIEADKARCGMCIGCYRTEKCGKCEQCSRDPPGLCIRLRCVQYEAKMKSAGRPRRETSKQVEEEDDKSRSLRTTNSPEKSRRGRKKGWKKDQSNAPPVPPPPPPTAQELVEKSRVPRIPELEKEIAHYSYESYGGRRRGAAKKKDVATENDMPRQCLEPNCVNQARESSKYCSDGCGLRLAKTRLTYILPGRVEEFWRVLPAAETRNNLWVEELNNTCDNINNTIHQLLDFYQMIVRYVNALKNVDPIEEEDETSHETLAHCTVCGVEINSRQLAKHVERCFVRSEKQITFGAHQLAQYNPNELFCEAYNKTSKTYCKRLKVMCAEHYKGELEASLKVCGCPKYFSSNEMKSFTDIFTGECSLLEGGFCTSPRKECHAHHRWLQSILGIIESERMNLLTKFGEVNERKTTLEISNQNRGDAISLLCCQTTGVANDKGS